MTARDRRPDRRPLRCLSQPARSVTVVIHDRTVIEAASWRLASELVRRHPTRTRLIRGHPGGGQYDVLWLIPADRADPGDVPMNRNGTIQVHARFDGRPMDDDRRWEPTEWVHYLAGDPREFLLRLESAAGLDAPESTPASTPRSLTYRVLAAVAATAVKTVHPIEIQEGFIDASDGGGRNPVLESFPIDPERLVAAPGDLFGEPRYRFWIITRDGDPLVAVDEADAVAWGAAGGAPFNLVDLYGALGRDVAVVAGDVLRRARSG